MFLVDEGLSCAEFTLPPSLKYFLNFDRDFYPADIPSSLADSDSLGSSEDEASQEHVESALPVVEDSVPVASNTSAQQVFSVFRLLRRVFFEYAAGPRLDFFAW
jgi:hypothetical protein